MIFMPYIVGIKKCDPIPACLPNTQIAGGIAAGARRFPLEQADTRVADGGGKVPTAFAGTIVDDDQYVGGKALGQNAVDDRQFVASGESVSVRLYLGGCLIIK